MPTRTKCIESAAVERRVVVHIHTDGHSVGCGKWTAKAVRGARMRERGASLLTSAAHHSGGLFGQARGKRSFEALRELLNIITAKLCNAAQGAVLTQF